MKQERLLNLSKPYIYCILIFILLFPSANSLNAFELIFTERGSDTSDYAGHRIAGVGDINGDGLDDVAICFKGRDSTFIYYGNNIKDSIPDQKVYGGFNVAYAHDVTGDGIGDIITSNGKYCLIYRGFGDSLGTQAFDTIYPDFGHYLTGPRFGSGLATGLINSDSVFDMIILTDFSDSRSRVRLLYGGVGHDSAIFDWSYNFPSYSHTLRSVIALDYDGNHQEDIMLGATGDVDSLGHIEIFNGNNLGDTSELGYGPPSIIISETLRQRFGFALCNTGDVNGDGYDDMGVTCGADYGLVYFCGSMFDTLLDLAILPSSTIISGLGDINGDNYDDFATGNAAFGFGDGRVTVFLGGPRVDSVADFWLTSWDLPTDILQRVGYQIAPAGDFNGDGLDDSMFSAETWSDSWQNGRVYIVAGDSDIVTDVISDDEMVSANFWIDNFPNPFNDRTTIRFSLPYKAQITIEIHDILGRRLKTLRSELLYAGTYSINWDGKSDSGALMSTGVYLLKYKAGQFHGEIKMLKLK